MNMKEAGEADLRRIAPLFFALHSIHVNMHPDIFRPVTHLEATDVFKELVLKAESTVMFAGKTML